MSLNEASIYFFLLWQRLVVVTQNHSLKFHLG